MIFRRRSSSISDGTLVVDFLRTLKPRYFIVYRDIALGYLALGGTVTIVAVGPWLGTPPLAAALAGAGLIGYWVAYLMLFLHEGAHYNLARSKTVSDRLCDYLISWIIGTSVSKYRLVHFPHHRALGTTSDSEHTYFLPLNLTFILKSLTGIHALGVILQRRKITAHREKATGSQPGRPVKNDGLVGFAVTL
jgi:hypothetical protein